MARIAENQGAEVARRKYGMLESALEDASNAGGKWSENPEMRLLMQVDSGGKPVGAASFQKGDVYGISNKDIMDMDFTGPEPGTLHSLGVLGQTEGGVPFKRGEEYIRQAQDMLGNDNLLFETINKPEFSNLEYYYNLGARPTGKKRNGGNPFYEFTQRAEREAPEVNENQLRLPGMAKGGWMDFTKSPTRASKQLHVSPKDIQQGHKQDLAALVARVAEQSRTVPTGEPYGQTGRYTSEELQRDAQFWDTLDQGRSAEMSASPSRASQIARAALSGAGSFGGWAADERHEPTADSAARMVGEFASDPLNAVGLGALKYAGKLAKKALPTALTASTAGYAADTEAASPVSFDRIIKGLRKMAPRAGYERTLPRAEGILETVRDYAPATFDVNRPDRLAELAMKASHPDERVRVALTTPRQFRNLAAELPQSAARDAEVDTLAEMLRTRESLPGGSKQGNYHFDKFPKFRGFGDVPTLNFMDTDDLAFSRIRGHEGRHRMRAVEQAYGDHTPLAIKAQGYEGEELDKALQNPFALSESASKIHSWYSDPDMLRLMLENNVRPVEFGVGGSVAGAAKRMAQRSMPRLQEGASSTAAPMGALSVVKPKGGNWINNSVEDALRGLKGREMDPLVEPDLVDEISRTKSMNSWVEGPLTKYVKTRMASPEDEVRRLAEEGVLHTYVPEGYEMAARKRRHTAKVGMENDAITPSGIAWEDMADLSIYPESAASRLRSDSYGFGTSGVEKAESVLRQNPWLSTVDPKTPVYTPSTTSMQDLGFAHLTDELRNALNPDSGLPRHLLLSPEAVKNMSMEKAVRRVADINAWRAEQKVAANAELANRAMAVRDYPHSDAMPNPKGLRWVELKSRPDEELYHNELRPKAMSKKDAHKELADQLKYEGDTMGHCVGGYCDDVASGRSRIFSLRDAKGEPHVTVEVNPPQQTALGMDTLPEEVWNAFAKAYPSGRQSDLKAFVAEHAPQYLPENAPLSISQIKGKQNRKPNDEYLPFVQDFVKNPPHGVPWGDVGDLGNTGLTKVGGRYADDAQMRELSIKHFGTDDTGKFSNGPGNGESAVAYYNRMKRMEQSMLSDIDKNFVADIDAGNFADGGTVSTKPNIRDIMQKLQEYHANA
jgi:hypothetical protein